MDENENWTAPAEQHTYVSTNGAHPLRQAQAYDLLIQQNSGFNQGFPNQQNSGLSTSDHQGARSLNRPRSDDNHGPPNNTTSGEQPSSQCRTFRSATDDTPFSIEQADPRSVQWLSHVANARDWYIMKSQTNKHTILFMVIGDSETA
jgi:hypothetical protein